MLDFEMWVISLSLPTIVDILRKHYDQHVNTEGKNGNTQNEVPERIDPAMQFHLDSILIHDDKDLAKLALEILLKHNKKLITREVKDRCIELGIV
jgi:hypothetical protein